MKDNLGVHISISGGISKAVDRGIDVGCNTMQIFTRNSNQWKGKEISESEKKLFKEKLATSKIKEVVSHDIYLINLASQEGDIREKSVSAFKDELKSCETLGIKKVVMHPGSYLTQTVEEGLDQVVLAFNEIFEELKDNFTGKVLIETTAGQGTNLGKTFEEISYIISKCKYPEKLAVCLDTCHVFAAGYDLTTEDGYNKTMKNFEETIGFNKLECFHLNDSKKGLSSRVDRHENIGQGFLGLKPFEFILNDKRFENIPMILETPKGKDEEGIDMDIVNLNLLRGLIKK